MRSKPPGVRSGLLFHLRWDLINPVKGKLLLSSEVGNLPGATLSPDAVLSVPLPEALD